MDESMFVRKGFMINEFRENLKKVVFYQWRHYNLEKENRSGRLEKCAE
jgi:hypothetical protein